MTVYLLENKLHETIGVFDTWQKAINAGLSCLGTYAMGSIIKLNDDIAGYVRIFEVK
jgi:hypothetical protein